MDKRDGWNVSVIGYGFLGSSIVSGFSLHSNIKVYDKYKEGFDTIEDTVNHGEFIFFCLPTPMFEDNGEQDLSIIEGAIKDVHNLVKDGVKKIAIIKSTVMPGTNRKFQQKYPKLTFISNPEHLTARNNRIDFICASKNVIGGESEEAKSRVEALYRNRFGNSMPIYKTSWETAEIEKYAVNTFFCVKVSFANFIYDVCQKLGLDYEEVKDIVLADGRIGRSHMDVPGNDGNKNYSGTCFPKDICAFINYSKQLGIDPKLLKASWEQNLEGRPEKDWEQLYGVISKREK